MKDNIPKKFPHIVIKPWGKEIWMEVNDKYCFKELHINAWNRTSLQYHERKKETVYVISGTLGVLLENEAGELEKKFLNQGEFLTIVPPKKHRMFTEKEEAYYLEASYPDVDDVIRIADDSGRKNGRIDSEHI